MDTLYEKRACFRQDAFTVFVAALYYYLRLFTMEHIHTVHSDLFNFVSHSCFPGRKVERPKKKKKDTVILHMY